MITFKDVSASVHREYGMLHAGTLFVSDIRLVVRMFMKISLYSHEVYISMEEKEQQIEMWKKNSDSRTMIHCFKYREWGADVRPF